ncbi:MAG: glycosyltransferase [Candidatus Binatia bacterium]
MEKHKSLFTQPHQSTASPPLSHWSSLEHFLGGRPAAYYRQLRTYYRRWKRIAGFDTPIWRILREAPYTRWVKEETQTLTRLRGLVTVPSQPTIAVFVPLHAPSFLWLEESISSVQAQWFPHWELWLCVAAVEASSISSFLKQSQERDSRIKVAIAPGSKTAVESLNYALGQTTCEFIGLLDAHDTLAPHALAEIAHWQQEKEADLFYSDEDEIDAHGRRSNPFFKPDWSPDLCLSSLYACHFGVYRRQLLQKVNGFRLAYAACLEYDLLLRCTEHSSRVIHIPDVLYHTRQSPHKTIEGKDAAQGVLTVIHESAKLALKEAFQRRTEIAVVNDGPALCTFHARRQLRGEPLISIIIPTHDRLDMLRVCIDSIEERTAYRNYELVIVDNGSQEPQTLAYLSASRHRVLRDDESFNFARLNNKAVAEAKGEYVLLLNNDVEAIAREWLTALLEHAQRKEVGAVGAQLLYADGTIQHAGVVLGLHGAAAPAC